jgi:hypothetical protein
MEVSLYKSINMVADELTKALKRVIVDSKALGRTKSSTIYSNSIQRLVDSSNVIALANSPYFAGKNQRLEI